MDIDPLERLEAALSDVTDVYVAHVDDAAAYIAKLEDNLRQVICDPFAINATVVEPGFPDVELGTTLSGYCVAHARGYWLVYQPERDEFLCFWGLEPEKLVAPGIFGSPLYCWSA